MPKTILLLLPFVLVTAAFPQFADRSAAIIGAAMQTNTCAPVLERLCDEAGGRLMGGAGNLKALAILEEELARRSMTTARESFSAPGWARGDDEVTLLEPARRTLRAVALGYVDAHATLQADAVAAGNGFRSDYAAIDAHGKIVLVSSGAPAGRDPLLRYEVIDTAASFGARAVLFVNDRPGGKVLAGVSNFQGKASAIPAYSITLEEGTSIQRLLARHVRVKMEITTRSRCVEQESFNLIARFPGRRRAKIVVGAHMDSWDLSQGAADNGIGTAVLFEVGRILQEMSPQNHYTVELVWFNGEELGLWGAKRYCERHRNDSILAMVNMDMTGSPRGVNTMGFSEYTTTAEQVVRRLAGFQMTQGVSNVPWTNSDHQPFLLAGIPSFAVTGHLDQESVEHYHDLADSYDKINVKYLSEAAAAVGVLVHELANNPETRWRRKTEEETKVLLQEGKLEDRLRRQKEWPWP